MISGYDTNFILDKSLPGTSGASTAVALDLTKFISSVATTSYCPITKFIFKVSNSAPELS